jgi:hypothetical protein
VTRAQRAAATGGMNSTPPSVDLLRPLGSSPVTVLSPDSDEKSEDVLYDSDSEETESEAELMDEDARLRMEEARLDEQLREIQTLVTQRRVLAKQQQLRAAQAELESDIGEEVPLLPVVRAQVVAVPVVLNQAVQTPARHNLRPRMLAFQSTVGRKPPTDESRDGRLMSTELGSVDVGAGGVTPLVPCAAVAVAGSTLPATGVGPALRPLRVSPYEHDNRWQCLSSVSQGTEWQDDDSDSSLSSETGHECAVDLFGVAKSTVMVSGDSLARLDVEKVVAPVKKVRPPDPVRECLRPLSGAWACTVDKKWKALRMRGKKAKGKSPGTVAAYTALFLRYLAAFSAHGVQSSDVHVIGRYVEGIKMEHEALYTVMLGAQMLLLYETLQEAIDAAEIAEASLKVCRMNDSSPASESLPDRKVALNEQNEGKEQEDTASAAPPSQFPPLNSRTYEEGLVSCGPPLGGWMPRKRSQTQEDENVKRSELGGELGKLDERSAGDECLLPHLPGDGRLWSSGGAL